MSIRYVTYATHEHGLYKRLINNEYGLKIEVLGWGTKWTGFMDKFKAVNAYIQDLNDDDIVCFLDGFDTLVNRDPSKALDLFKTKFNDAKIVASAEENINPIRSYMTRRVFGSCIDGETLNSGMYMGYVSELKRALKLSLKQDTTDDQVAMNSVCHRLDIVIDTKGRLFQNSSSTPENTDSRAIFVSYPAGSASWNDLFTRAIRAVPEYSGYFVVEITVLVVFIAMLWWYSR